MTTAWPWSTRCPRCGADARRHQDTWSVDLVWITREWACMTCRLVWHEREVNPCPHPTFRPAHHPGEVECETCEARVAASVDIDALYEREGVGLDERPRPAEESP